MSEENTVVEESTQPEAAPEAESQAEQPSEAPQQEETQAEQQARLIRELQLKIDGEEFSEELPFEIPEEHAEYLKQKLQLATVAQKRMQESAQSKKESEQLKEEFTQFLIALKEDPESILGDPNIGVDLKALAEGIMAKELEEAQKPEEQKEREALEKKLKELEDAKAKLEEERKQQEKDLKMKELKAEEDRIAAQMQAEITDEIQNNNLPNDPEMLKLVASNMRAAMRYGVNVSVKEIVPFVKKELYEKSKNFLKGLTDDEVAEFLGQDRLNSIRKSMIKRLKSEVPSASQIKDQGKAEEEKQKDVFERNKKDEKINSKKWSKDIMKKYNVRY